MYCRRDWNNQALAMLRSLRDRCELDNPSLVVQFMLPAIDPAEVHHL